MCGDEIMQIDVIFLFLCRDEEGGGGGSDNEYLFSMPGYWLSGVLIDFATLIHAH